MKVTPPPVYPVVNRPPSSPLRRLSQGHNCHDWPNKLQFPTKLGLPLHLEDTHDTFSAVVWLQFLPCLSRLSPEVAKNLAVMHYCTRRTYCNGIFTCQIKYKMLGRCFNLVPSFLVTFNREYKNFLETFLTRLVHVFWSAYDTSRLKYLALSSNFIVKKTGPQKSPFYWN